MKRWYKDKDAVSLTQDLNSLNTGFGQSGFKFVMLSPMAGADAIGSSCAREMLEKFAEVKARRA